MGENLKEDHQKRGMGFGKGEVDYFQYTSFATHWRRKSPPPPPEEASYFRQAIILIIYANPTWQCKAFSMRTELQSKTQWERERPEESLRLTMFSSCVSGLFNNTQLGVEWGVTLNAHLMSVYVFLLLFWGFFYYLFVFSNRKLAGQKWLEPGGNIYSMSA